MINQLLRNNLNNIIRFCNESESCVKGSSQTKISLDKYKRIKQSEANSAIIEPLKKSLRNLRFNSYADSEIPAQFVELKDKLKASTSSDVLNTIKLLVKQKQTISVGDLYSELRNNKLKQYMNKTQDRDFNPKQIFGDYFQKAKLQIISENGDLNQVDELSKNLMIKDGLLTKEQADDVFDKSRADTSAFFENIKSLANELPFVDRPFFTNWAKKEISKENSNKLHSIFE